MSALLIPIFYGINGNDWPPGSYWIVEVDAPLGRLVLFWCARKNSLGREVWTTYPCYAAGFASQDDARKAFIAIDIHPFQEGGSFRVCEHVWEEGP